MMAWYIEKIHFGSLSIVRDVRIRNSFMHYYYKRDWYTVPHFCVYLIFKPHGGLIYTAKYSSTNSHCLSD
jgi:hypothetical protein